MLRWTSLVQGSYYVLTGLWALVSRRTFEAVTGPKTDFWLAKTVGVLVGVIGGVLTFAGARDSADPRRVPEVPLLAAGSAAALAGIDVYYVARRRIGPVYLLDAVAETLLLLAWATGWCTQPRTHAEIATPTAT